MTLERRHYGPTPGPSGTSSLADLIDRILDKGLVADAWIRVSLVGIELITIEARIVVASVDTYLKYAEAIAQTALAAEPHAYRREIQSMPTDDQVADYLNTHPNGASLDEVASFFQVSREELKPILQRLTSGPRIRVDNDRLLPSGASDGAQRNGSHRNGSQRQQDRSNSETEDQEEGTKQRR